MNFPFAGPLVPAHASAVILVFEPDRYVLQRRDNKPDIFYPGHLGLFGGALLDGESYEDAAIREVMEETELVLTRRLRFFSSMKLGFEPFRLEPVDRMFYTAELTEADLSVINVHEGQGMEIKTGQELLTNEQVVPYDSFALWLHVNKR